MRGAHAYKTSGVTYERIIPADAGSTHLYHPYYPHTPDHPRGCGEHNTKRQQMDIQQGSSPRMRGAQSSDASVSSLTGIIPADAGSTAGGRCPGCPSGDHPRGCGEHLVQDLGERPCRGSSPRMRGALSPRITVYQVVGGSSPRMRGALGYPHGWRIGVGIIPADAGSTAPNATVPGKTQDHPRGCGEHATLKPDAKGLAGSSPRMRGARDRRALQRDRYRIIPADAGSTR